MPGGLPDTQVAFPGPCSRGSEPGHETASEEEVTGHSMGTEDSLRCRASASRLDIWTAHFGLFAQRLTFVQPLNSLHWLECKHRPMAEAASLGRHPAIQGLGLLRDGSRCSQHCGCIFSTSLLCTPPNPCGRDREF